MAHLWVADPEQLWSIAPLEHDLYSIGVGDSGSAEITLGEKAWQTLVARHRAEHGKASWVLMAAPGQRITVNGAETLAGLRVLQDRDHIRLFDKETAVSFFYSAELIPRVEAFPGADTPVACPRCKIIIEPGASAVKCPGCGAWYHQSEEYPCWSYADKCALCKHPADMEAGYQFTPEDL